MNLQKFKTSNHRLPAYKMQQKKDNMILIGETLYHLNTSLAQGAGPGASVPLIDALKSTARETDKNHYIVDKEILDLLAWNNTYTRNMLNNLNFLISFLREPLNISYISVKGITDIMVSLTKNLTPHLKKRNLKLIIGKADTLNELKIDVKKIEVAIEEILINALKYSKNGTSLIFSFHDKVTGFITFELQNEINTDYYHGITEENEESALEPFIRFHPPIEDDIINAEKFNLGLGLYAVKYIIEIHKGFFHIGNKTHEGTTKVVASMLLPVPKQEE